MKTKLCIKILGNVAPFSINDKNCSGYLIESNTEKILLDCGFGVSKEICMLENMKNLSIFITHFHKDHYSDLFAIGYASYCFHKLGLLNDKIDVYIPKMENDEEGYLDYKLLKEFKEHYFNIIEYDENSIVNINDFRITFCFTKHLIKSYAIKVSYNDKIVSYSGDMGYDNVENLSNFFKKSDLFICETTYLVSDNVVDNNHLNTKQAAEISKMSKVKKLYFAHTWPNNSRNMYFNELKNLLKDVDKINIVKSCKKTIVL